MNYPYKPTSSMQFIDWQNKNCCTCRHYKFSDGEFSDDSCILEFRYCEEVFLGGSSLTPEENDTMFSDSFCKAREKAEEQ